MEEKLLWEKYKHEVEVHKGYLGLAIKLNIFYYAITGAIISFYFLHVGTEPLVRWSLVLPFIMSIGIGIVFWQGAKASKVSHFDMESLAEELGFEFHSIVARILANSLKVFSILLFLTCIGLFILLLKDFSPVIPGLTGDP